MAKTTIARYIPLLILPLQILNLAQAAVFGAAIAGNNDGYVIGLIQRIACCHAAYAVFIAVNSVVVFLVLITHIYFWINITRYYDYYGYDFARGHGTVFKILLFIAEVLIPILFYPWLILASIWDGVNYRTTNSTFAIIFTAGTLLHLWLTTALLSYIYKNRREAEVDDDQSVKMKWILTILYTLFVLAYAILQWIWTIIPPGENTTQHVIVAAMQWLAWIFLWAWHATFYYELGFLDIEKERRTV
ncbi:hypothetical protein RCL1_002532 [Eukaryota sp. TZLM3-RCL]